jgi:multicomponent Na+:H+ antiporter subunit G
MMELAALFFLALGMLFVVVAAVGLLRLPDVYCRSHALGKAFTLGVNSMLVGLWFKQGGAAFGLKVALVVTFMFLTIPVATHLITRLAWRAGIAQSPEKAKTDHGAD